jgi:hypothetical protein
MEKFSFLPHPRLLSNWRGERFCEAVGLFTKRSVLLWFLHYVTKESSLPRQLTERFGDGTLRKADIGIAAI